MNYLIFLGYIYIGISYANFFNMYGGRSTLVQRILFWPLYMVADWCRGGD